MDAATSWLDADWNLGRAATLLQQEGKIRPSLMVLIANSGSFRRIEYGDNAIGRQYVNWICDELKPLVDREFPTLRDPRHTFALGSSMGGSISYLATLWRPEIFGNACALSPMFEPQTIAAVVAAPGIYRSRPQHKHQRIYIDNGGSTPDTQVVKQEHSMLMQSCSCAWRKRDVSPDKLTPRALLLAALDMQGVVMKHVPHPELSARTERAAGAPLRRSGWKPGWILVARYAGVFQFPSSLAFVSQTRLAHVVFGPRGR